MTSKNDLLLKKLIKHIKNNVKSPSLEINPLMKDNAIIIAIQKEFPQIEIEFNNKMVPGIILTKEKMLNPAPKHQRKRL